MLDIRNIFDEVCDDCIGVILDFVDPIDVLKLIYYNKHHLYLRKGSNKKRKITTDPIQLLLFEKFYSKVLGNLEIYTKERKAKWENISKLLDKNTVISGGSLLQAIYGPIENETTIPIDFYYSQQLRGREKNGYTSYQKKKTRTVTTLSDIDIYTMTKERLFDTRGIQTYVESRDICVAQTEKGDISAIFDIYVGGGWDDEKVEEEILRNIDIEKMENYDYRWDKVYKKIIKDREHEIEAYIKVRFGRGKDQLYKILNFELFDKNNLTIKNLLRCVVNSSHDIKYWGIAETFMTERVRDVVADYDDSIKYILFYSDNTLLRRLQNSDDPYTWVDSNYIEDEKDERNERDNENSSFKTESIAYSSLELKECDGTCDKKVKQWEESIYDPFVESREYLLEREEETWEGPSMRTMEFHSHRSKKIIPTIEVCGKELLLNVIYIDGNRYDSPKKFIEEDFDLNVCKQTYDGEKIRLYDVGDLLKKICRYNLNHTSSHMEGEYRIERYICFKKRLEKYKARGFEIHDEYELIKKVRYILNRETDEKLYVTW